MEEKSPELKVAIEAALSAGKILEKHFETDIIKEFKEDNSPVTLADRESEKIIKEIICRNFPEHSILGEETGMTVNKSDYVWYIDPIDGTRNFSNHIPVFAVSIALAFQNEIVLGVVYNPTTDILFYAEKNKGAYCNSKRIFVSKDDISHSMITASRGKGKSVERLFRELMYYFPKNVVTTVRDMGCSALDLACVASGGFEADIQLGLNSYDFAAGVILVKEAGGKISALDGSPYIFPNNYFIASNGVFHDVLVDEVNKQKLKLNNDIM